MKRRKAISKHRSSLVMLLRLQKNGKKECRFLFIKECQLFNKKNPCQVKNKSIAQHYFSVFLKYSLLNLNCKKQSQVEMFNFFDEFISN